MPKKLLKSRKHSLLTNFDSDFSQVDFKEAFRPIDIGSVTKLQRYKIDQILFRFQITKNQILIHCVEQYS